MIEYKRMDTLLHFLHREDEICMLWLQVIVNEPYRQLTKYNIELSDLVENIFSHVF